MLCLQVVALFKEAGAVVMSMPFIIVQPFFVSDFENAFVLFTSTFYIKDACSDFLKKARGCLFRVLAKMVEYLNSV